MACLLGLLRIDRLARAISAVTRVIVILAMDLHIRKVKNSLYTFLFCNESTVRVPYLPSNLCFKKSRELFASCL